MTKDELSKVLWTPLKCSKEELEFAKEFIEDLRDKLYTFDKAYRTDSLILTLNFKLDDIKEYITRVN